MQVKLAERQGPGQGSGLSEFSVLLKRLEEAKEKAGLEKAADKSEETAGE